MKIQFRWPRGLLSLFFAFFIGLNPARADVTSVSASPGSAAVQVPSNTVLSLTWTVTSIPYGPPSWTIASGQGQVLADGVPIATVNQTLSSPASGSSPVTAVIPESLNVPTVAIQSALQNGASTITYRRIFSDGSAITSSAQITLLATFASAQLLSVQAVPAQIQMAISQAARPNVTWAVASTVPSQRQWTVSSPVLQLLADGSVITAINQPLSRTVSTTRAVQISETAILPLGALQAALNRGSRNITLQRTFSLPGGQSRTASVRILPLGNLSADFAVSRLELSFDDNSLVRVIDRNEKLTARLLVNYAGAGILQGAWQIADGVSTSGQPFYRTIKTVRSSVIAGQQAALVSPELPSETSGTYIVRFVLSDPEFNTEAPFLRYAVRSGGLLQPGQPPMSVSTKAPGAGGMLRDDTTFSWSPAQGAFAYKLELYELTLQKDNPVLSNLPVDGVPTLEPFGEAGAVLVGGKYVEPGQTETVLGRVTFDQLSPGKVFAWRIVALGDGGIVIAVSPFNYLVTQ